MGIGKERWRGKRWLVPLKRNCKDGGQRKTFLKDGRHEAGQEGCTQTYIIFVVGHDGYARWRYGRVRMGIGDVLLCEK